MEIKKNTLFAILTIFLILGAGFFIFIKGSSGASGNSVLTAESNDVQKVKLFVEGGRYVLEPNTMKIGAPVKIEADISRMPGCSKSVVISAFNVRKTLTNNDNIITFTPTKSGTFNIACSMNMYRGTFTIAEKSGIKSNYVEQPISGGSSCGGSGGGCGCGG